MTCPITPSPFILIPLTLKRSRSQEYCSALRNVIAYNKTLRACQHLLGILGALFDLPTLLKNVLLGREKCFLSRQPPAVQGNRMAVDAPRNLQCEEKPGAFDKTHYLFAAKVLKCANCPFAHRF